MGSISFQNLLIILFIGPIFGDFCLENKDHNSDVWTTCTSEAFREWPESLFITAKVEFRDQNCLKWSSIVECIEKKGGFCSDQEKTGPGLSNFINQLCSDSEAFDIYWEFYQRAIKMSNDGNRVIQQAMESCLEEEGLDKHLHETCFASKNPCDQRVIDNIYVCALNLADKIPIEIDKLDKLLQNFLVAFGHKKTIMINYKGHCSLKSRRNAKKLDDCSINILKGMTFSTDSNIPALQEMSCRYVTQTEECVAKAGGLEQLSDDCKAYNRAGIGSLNLAQYFCSNEEDLERMVELYQQITSWSKGDMFAANAYIETCLNEDNFEKEDVRNCISGKGFCEQRLVDITYQCFLNDVVLKDNSLKDKAKHVLPIVFQAFGLGVSEDKLQA